MPPLALAALFHRALPWLSPDGRAVISTLICDNGRVGSTQALCERLGLRSRFQLNRAVLNTGGRPREIAFGPGHVIVANESGWIDLLPIDRRHIYSFDRPSPPTAPIALSVS